MQKRLIILSLVSASLFFSYCNPSKKATGSDASAAVKAPAKSTYETGVATMVQSHCSPCHIAGKGNKKPYDNYANLKTDIDEVIRRMELEPGVRGFMPFKKTAKLSDSVINVFKQWKTDGLLEK